MSFLTYYLAEFRTQFPLYLVNINVNLRQQKWADVGGGCLVTFTEKIFSLEIQLYLLQNSPFSLNMRHSTELFENVSNSVV